MGCRLRIGQSVVKISSLVCKIQPVPVCTMGATCSYVTFERLDVMGRLGWEVESEAYVRAIWANLANTLGGFLA